ncbi:ADP-ribosylglycohydrolase family protein [Parabacteroides sp. PF5-6]|uniref:ADP-ribosylglycohydrolase family protein n=1 Tax=Parabacteroides sp. PF5-6 TaxID=1742403 RepID=UPI002406FA84|nr:ADP-ribosylglycohydrolase family protein [Parabacteroides sp. PF5-6]MDF9828846.1 ADP-ribosylglycohydrolase [Parabacteroides sp. PF5-6]
MKDILRKLWPLKQKEPIKQREEIMSIEPSAKEPIDLIAFFRNEQADVEGRMLEDILQFSFWQIENKHDFIQWIFPTKEKSRFNGKAPILDKTFVSRFQKDELAKNNFCRSCQMYLNHIGLNCLDKCVSPDSSGNKFYEMPTHNLLRISRMLNSLNQVGNRQCSWNIYNNISKEAKLYPNKINEETLLFWKGTQEDRFDYSNLILGAIAGDIIGSRYESKNIKSVDFSLFSTWNRFTDDTVMTVAVADWLSSEGCLQDIVKGYGLKYPHAGYGRLFRDWLNEEDPQPYNSWGNGSAMRVSYIGWAFDTLDEVLQVAKESAEITHNHPEGIKGAQAVAACVYLARVGNTKKQIKEYIETTFGYDLSRTCDKIRPSYQFDVSCQGSVPEAIIAFLESTDFEYAIRLAISLGGDSDTIAAITGGIAEAYYKDIPLPIKREVLKRIPDEFEQVIRQFYAKFVLR